MVLRLAREQRRTRKDRRNAPGVGVGGDTALRAPLVRLLLHVIEPAPRLSPLDLLLELRTLQLNPQAQLVFFVCTQFILLELPGLELGGALGDELGGGASAERSLALVIVKLKLRGRRDSGGAASPASSHCFLPV